MSNYVENFINSLGIKGEYAKVVLKDEQDCKEYFSMFLGRGRTATDDMFNYREHKIKESNLSYDIFVSSIENQGFRFAVETHMLQPLNTYDEYLFLEAFEKGTLTYHNVFESFKNNINLNIIKILSH